MKKTGTLIVLLTLVWVVGSCGKASEQEQGAGDARVTGPAPAVAWLGFNEGLKSARETRKPLVLSFYADWCGWCRKMDAEVFRDSEVSGRLARDYVTVQFRTDRDPDEVIRYKNHTLTKREFSMMLGVEGLPTVVFLESDGSVITKIPGYIEKPMFLSLLGYIRDECYKRKVSFDDYTRGGSPCGKKE